MKKLRAIFSVFAAVVLLTVVSLSSCKNAKGGTESTTENDSTSNDSIVAQPLDTVVVKTARDFILALKSNRCIIVDNKEMVNLTEALDELIEEGLIKDYMDNGEPRNEEGVFFESQYDGHQLTIMQLSRLVIEAKESAYFVVSPMYADVLCLIGCKDVTVKGFTLGHMEVGDCIGDVLRFDHCERVNVDNCHLFGCGVNAIQAVSTSTLRVNNTHLYGCSQYGAVLTNADDALFDSCQIYSNGCGIYVDEQSDNIVFDHCEILNNRGQLFSCLSPVKIKNSKIEHHYDDVTTNVSFEHCEVMMDYAEAEVLPDVEHE